MTRDGDAKQPTARQQDLENGATVAQDTDLATERTTAVDGSGATIAAEAVPQTSRPSSIRIGPSKALVTSTAAATGEPKRPGAALGRYVVLSRLGAGGMGEVYAAYDPELDRRIAVKVIRPVADEGTIASARSRLLAEAQALAKLSHPNVVTVYDVGTFGDDVYIAMEYVDGKTLTAWLDAGERTWSEIVDMFVATGRGLEAAHAQGLVHRDIKPDNIIIGNDGRVRLIDFGVALATEARFTRGEQIASTALVGTPAYMAPEQFTGGEIGAHTDQFSFGVALYQALWKQKPFAGDTVLTLAETVCEGRLSEAPASDVPAWLRAAVFRALSREPEARYPAMTALLDAIKPPTRRRVWPYLVAASAIAIVALLIGVRAGSRHHASCEGFERELVGVWDPARKRAVEQAFASAKKVDEWPAVERSLDTYATTWVSHKVAACRATSMTREQPATVLERRMACLDSRRRELDAAVTVLAGGAIAQAWETAASMRSLGACDNLAALGRQRPKAAATGELHAVEDGLARVRALRMAGDYKAARTHAGLVVERARQIGWGGAHAESLVLRGLTESLDGDPKTARETLFEAIRRGDEADDPASQAEAWVALVGVEATGLRQPTEALRWSQHAEIALAKAGGDQEQRALLLHNIGSAHRLLEHHDEALDKYRQALALLERAFGPRHYRVARERAAIASSYRNLGKLDDAVRDGEASLQMLEELLGTTHPALAPVLNNLALTYDGLDQFDDARATLERALAIKEHELGGSHPSLAASLLNLAALERRSGRFDVADALWQRAYDIRVATLGANHADTTRALFAKLVDRAGRGLDDEGLVLAAEVAARLRGHADAVELGSALGVQCELLRRARRLDDAQASCREAIATLGESPDGNRAAQIFAYAARLAAHRGEADAPQLAERARAALTTVTRDQRLAKAFVGWAAAHVDLAAGRRDDAIREARDARAAFVAEGAGRKHYVDDLDRAVK